MRCKPHSMSQVQWIKMSGLVPPGSSCLIPKQLPNTNGYVRVLVGGKYVAAHRLMWEHYNGPIPEKMQIDHVCRNRACCNIEHLRCVTPQVNSTQNVVGIGWQLMASKSHCKNGHEFTPENTYERPTGGRGCRTCRTSAVSRYRKADH